MALDAVQYLALVKKIVSVLMSGSFFSCLASVYISIFLESIGFSTLCIIIAFGETSFLNQLYQLIFIRKKKFIPIPNLGKSGL